jgi:hypothetical protein
MADRISTAPYMLVYAAVDGVNKAYLAYIVYFDKAAFKI